MDRLRVTIGFVAVLLWAVNFMASLTIKSYEGNRSVDIIMMAVVGALFGRELLRRNNGRS